MIRLLALLLSLGVALPVMAAQAELDALVNSLKQERRAEQRHHGEREDRFLAERDRRQALLEALREQKQQAEAEAERLRQRHMANDERLQALEEELAQATGELGELFDSARQTAADTRARQADSMMSAQFPQRIQTIQDLADAQRLPRIDQLEGLWISLLDEMNQAGRISRFNAPVIAPDGSEQGRSVLRVGPFSAMADGRYLRYLPEAGRFVEPARQPPLRTLLLARPAAQTDETVRSMAVDPTRGTLLGLMVRSPSILERIQQGGVIGYVILGLGGFALLLVLERLLILGWVRLRMGRQARRDQPHQGNPLGRLSLLAQQHAEASLEAMDMHLDEALTREAGRLTRGLTTLGVVAAIAPLLGLLGTVTGMIETFQTITLFGSGDPKLMSSGISQALVTTQLGLVVAVPVLLLHSLLKGRANRLIETMDRHSTLLLSVRA